MHNDWTVNTYGVILESVGDRRVEVMRAIRRHVRMAQLADARDMLAGLPRAVLSEAQAEDAFTLAWQLFEAGADVRVMQTAREYPVGCWAGDEGPAPIGEPVVQEVPRDWWLNFGR